MRWIVIVVGLVVMGCGDDAAMPVPTCEPGDSVPDCGNHPDGVMESECPGLVVQELLCSEGVTGPHLCLPTVCRLEGGSGMCSPTREPMCASGAPPMCTLYTDADRDEACRLSDMRCDLSGVTFPTTEDVVVRCEGVPL